MYNYLKPSILNLLSDWKIRLITILGIALSFTAILLITSYVANELSYDLFHGNKDNIYRVESKRYRNETVADNWASSPNALAPALKKDVAGIADFVRLTIQREQTERLVARNDIRFRETRTCFTEPSFFTIFSFDLLEGNPETALSKPNTVVITEEMAHKYFGSENPMGKLLTFSSDYRKSEYEVTGIIKTLPENSHFKFDFFISWNTLSPGFRNSWGLYAVYTYILTEPGVQTRDILEKYNAIAENYPASNKARNLKLELELQAITDIHFNKVKPYEIETKGNKANVMILISIGIVILIIAWINYINLYLSSVYRKVNNYIIRKVTGANFRDLTLIFVTDAFIIFTVSIPVAILLALAVLPFFNQVMGLQLSLTPALHPLFWLTYLSYFVLVLIFSGIIPAYNIFYRKSLNWKNDRYGLTYSVQARKLLVVVQFAASIVLIAGTLTVYKQLHSMYSQSLGYSVNQRLVIRNPSYTDNYGTKLTTFTKEIEKLANVYSVSSSGVIPGMQVANFIDLKRNGFSDSEAKYLEMYPIDQNFTSTYEISFVAGNNLPDSDDQAQNKFLLNEEAVKLLGFKSNEEAIGQQLVFGNFEPMLIAGVVKNFHQQSLEKQFTPLAFVHHRTFRWLPPKYVNIHLNTSDLPATMKQIRHSWDQFFTSSSFDYFFVDRYFNKQYRKSESFGFVFSVFAGLALFIAVLGLLGLSIFASQKRIKEIGIRKANGAKSKEIVRMLNKDFLKWVGIAFVIACPVAWYTMNKWLHNFAYKTELSWWIFALAGLIAAGVALCTVSFQSWRAAAKNPAESLRYE